MEPFKIIKHPLSTEKSIRLLEAENKLVFVIAPKATRKQVKEAVEKLFKVSVTQVNTLKTPSGEKRAFVKLGLATPAIDIATDLGLM
jgi:large subunit ribosomal protein L23